MPLRCRVFPLRGIERSGVELMAVAVTTALALVLALALAMTMTAPLRCLPASRFRSTRLRRAVALMHARVHFRHALTHFL